MKSNIFNPLNEIKQLLEQTFKEINVPSISKGKQIHSIRVMTKKIRSLLYLIKPFFDDKTFLKSQNQFYKELSKSLSQEREIKVMYDTFQWLVKKSKLPKDSFEEIQTMLQQNLEKKAAADADINKKLQICKQSMMVALETLNSHKKSNYITKDLKVGFLKTYKKARDTLHFALTTKEIEDVHLFRKYAKYHMYQIQLLSNQLKHIKRRKKDLDKLTSLLGKSHDLVLFTEYLHNNKTLTNSDILLSYISKEEEKLIKKSLKIAKRAFKYRARKLKIFHDINH